MKRVLTMPRRSLLTLVALIAIVVVAGIADHGLALTLAPAVLLLATFAGGYRPGEALIERLRERRAAPRAIRATSARIPHLALVVRPAGRLIASALAMRPPPFPLAVSS
jgi:hypothetical protein